MADVTACVCLMVIGNHGCSWLKQEDRGYYFNKAIFKKVTLSFVGTKMLVLGLKSLVLESSESSRTTGFALTLWTNAWRALDAVGVAPSLRQRSLRIRGGDYESRCLERKELLETLRKELPPGTIRYSSKVVLIEESGRFKLVHLADGSILKTKVLIGCDGINSVVAKWLGLQKPVYAGRSAIRGLAEYPSGHGFEPKIYTYFGGGFRFGFVPCTDKTLYWFFTYTPSVFQYDEDMEENPIKMKQFVLSKIANVAQEASDAVDRTELKSISSAQLKLRLPWNLIFGDIVKRNVCVVGDALHPMTPDIGQGGCSALEDSVVLARCLGEALLAKRRKDIKDDEEEEFERIRNGVEKYGKERRWRSFNLISTAYLVGLIQESDGKVLSFLREKWLSKYTPDAFLRCANYDCGKLLIS
ncbi:hypothetical protein LguiA_006885 [Lonicera macranthoides]